MFIERKFIFEKNCLFIFTNLNLSQEENNWLNDEARKVKIETVN